MGIVDDRLAADSGRIRTCYRLVAGKNLIDNTWVRVAVFVALSLGHTATSFIRQRHQTRTFNPAKQTSPPTSWPNSEPRTSTRPRCPDERSW